MTPHQALALSVRLFVVWFALVTLRVAFVFFGNWRSFEGYDVLWVVIGGFVVTAGILFALWRFPNPIARGLLPDTNDVPAQTASYRKWFTLVAALIGLWFVASAIAPVLRNLSVMYIFQPELTYPERSRQLQVGIFYYLVEASVGLCLLFGANAVTRFVWWVRRAGPE